VVRYDKRSYGASCEAATSCPLQPMMHTKLARLPADRARRTWSMFMSLRSLIDAGSASSPRTRAISSGSPTLFDRESLSSASETCAAVPAQNDVPELPVGFRVGRQGLEP